MALNEIYKDADSLSYVVPGTVKGGDLVAVGGIIGVAETDARPAIDVAGFTTTLRHVGVWAFEATGSVDAGDAVYAASADLAGGTQTVTLDDEDGTLVGYAYRAKTGSGAGPVYVRINN